MNDNYIAMSGRVKIINILRLQPHVHVSAVISSDF